LTGCVPPSPCRSQRRSRAFHFREEGHFQEKAARQRATDKLAQLQEEIAAAAHKTGITSVTRLALLPKKVGLDRQCSQTISAAVLLLLYRLPHRAATINLLWFLASVVCADFNGVCLPPAARRCRMQELMLPQKVPDVEWWDLDLLPSGRYVHTATAQHCQRSATECYSCPALGVCSLPQRTPTVGSPHHIPCRLPPTSYDDIGGGRGTKPGSITSLIEHPIQIEPPNAEKPIILPIMLTKTVSIHPLSS